jgi:hypothetical protein
MRGHSRQSLALLGDLVKYLLQTYVASGERQVKDDTSLGDFYRSLLLTFIYYRYEVLCGCKTERKIETP